ncbi:Retrotransposon gag protein [Rhizoctonia solani]|uniref:Retrotransposon gag protein n=1 Tax=Rhizoctonia solani TaxID=456999 RepID=A0A8H8NYR3_9AGAM|nr:Retrotransposon gag protein [Rhizoctonia solani]QRW21202.1 Retrotransposon gag protein [Rhizoctonia solani]
MEPEPTLAALLEAITALTATVGSLQDQIKSQGQQLNELKAICKETANLVGNKDQGGPQAKPGPPTGPALFHPSRGTGFDSEDEEEPRRAPKKEPCNMPRSLSSLTPFDSGSSMKRPKMELPDPYKGDTRGQKATQWLDCMLLWVALHRDQFDEEEQMVVWILYHMTDKAANWALPLIGAIIKGEGNPPNTIPALMAKFKEAFADPDAKRAAGRKIAALSQVTTTSEYVMEFCNLMAELDWNKEAYIAQFTQGLHWKVKELLSTKDNVPDKLKAIFAASIKIDNTHCKNEENQPKKQPAKSLVTATTSTTTTQWGQFNARHYFPHAVFTIPSTRSGVPHPYSRPTSRSSRRSVAANSQPPTCKSSPTPQNLPGMEPEPSIGALLEAIQALSTQVGSLQDQVKSQGKQITQLTALCKETNNLVGDKDQGGAQTKPGPSTGPTTPPTHTGGEAHTPATIRPGLKAPFQPSRGTGFDSEDEEEPRHPKREPQGTPKRHLGSLTPFDAGSSVKRPKMDLPDPYKGDTRGRKATQWLDRMMLWVALHRDQFDKEEQMVVWILYHMTNKAANWALPIIGAIIKGKGNPPTTIQALTAKFKEAFADPDAKQAAARKIAALSQTTTTSEYVTEFRNLMAELDWNEEAYIAQFTRGLHWKVKELLSTKDSIPDELEAIFAASIKIDNICRKNEENRPKKAPAKSPTTTSTTTTQRVRLSEDPNYVTPEERDRRRASGLCVKCGQKGHGIKQCPNGWKATVKEVAKIAEDVKPGKD